MRSLFGRCLIIAIGWIAGNFVSAQAQVARPTTAPRYPQIKAWHEQQWALATTPSEKMEILRQTVRRGRYSGDHRLMNMFKNFEGDFAIDPELPGLRKTLLLLASDNQN